MTATQKLKKPGVESVLAAAAQVLLDLGVQNVVMKGGHSKKRWRVITCFWPMVAASAWRPPRIDTPNTHGTGCTFSAALTAFVAQGLALPEAMVEAKRFIHLGCHCDLHLGHGHGPTNHLLTSNKKANVRWTVFGREQLKLYFIMGSQDMGGDLQAALNVLEQALKDGITLFQWREKGAGSLAGQTAEYEQFARDCLALCRQYGVPFW